MAVASTGYTLIGKETWNGTTKVWDTPVRDDTANPNYFFYPAEEVEIMPGKEFIDFREIRGSRQAMITLDGPFRPTAMMRGALYPTGATAHFLAGVLGGMATDSTLTTGVYKHSFVDRATLPQFTIERSDTQGAGATLIEKVAGCKVESLQIGCAFGEKANLTVNFQATKKPETLATTFFADAGITDNKFPNSMLPYAAQGELIDPLIFKDATIKMTVDGTEKTLYTVKNINLEIRNTLTRQETLTGTDQTYKLFEGGLECTLSGAMVFEDVEMYQYLINGKAVSIRLTFANQQNKVNGSAFEHAIEFYWPSIKVSRASVPFRAGEVIESDLEFKVRFDQALSRMVEIYMTDSRQSSFYGY